MAHILKMLKNSSSDNIEEKNREKKAVKRGCSSIDLNQSLEDTDPHLSFILNSSDTVQMKPSEASEPLQGEQVVLNEEIEFWCNFCTKKFPNKQALGGHQNAHKFEKAKRKRVSQGHEGNFGYASNDSSNGMTSFAFPNSFNQALKMESPHHPVQDQMYAHGYPGSMFPMTHESGAIPKSHEIGVNQKSHESGVTQKSQSGVTLKFHESGVTPMSHVSGVTPMSHVSGVAPMSHVSGVAPMSHVSGVAPMSHVSSVAPMSHVSSVAPMSHVSGVTPMSHVSGVTPMSRESGVKGLRRHGKGPASSQFRSFKARMEQGASSSKGKSIAIAEDDRAEPNRQVNNSEKHDHEDDLDLTLKL